MWSFLEDKPIHSFVNFPKKRRTLFNFSRSRRRVWLALYLAESTPILGSGSRGRCPWFWTKRTDSRELMWDWNCWNWNRCRVWRCFYFPFYNIKKNVSVLAFRTPCENRFLEPTQVKQGWLRGRLVPPQDRQRQAKDWLLRHGLQAEEAAPCRHIWRKPFFRKRILVFNYFLSFFSLSFLSSLRTGEQSVAKTWSVGIVSVWGISRRFDGSNCSRYERRLSIQSTGDKGLLQRDNFSVERNDRWHLKRGREHFCLSLYFVPW